MSPMPRRTNPRRRTILRLEAGPAREQRVLNLSVNGMFVAGVREEEAAAGAIWLPGADRPLEVRFRNFFNRPTGVGVQFDPSDRRTRHELYDYVTHHHEEARLRELEPRVAGGAGNLKPLAEDEGTRDVFAPLVHSTATIEVYRDSTSEPLRAQVTGMDVQNARLTLRLASTGAMPGPRAFDPLFLAARRGDAIYVADTVVESRNGHLLSVMLPERVFFPERRALERDDGRGSVLRIEIEGSRLGEVTDADANGVAALFYRSDADTILAHPRVTTGHLNDPQGEREAGPLRPVWNRPTADGRVHIGFERLRERSLLEPIPLSTRYRPAGRAAAVISALHVAWGSVLDRVGLASVPPPHLWTMEEASGRPLVHLVNANFDLDRPPDEPIHVVLIPPPYGRKKEMPGALALTLLAGFRSVGKPVLILRWDGRNHVGESWRDPELVAPEHAMLHYTQSQAVADLADTIRNVAARFPGRTLRTAVVSFSLAAVAVRRYLADGGEGVDLWVSPMGAADARDTIRNGNGGVDLVGLKKRGEALGIRLIQGHLVDADRHCGDLWEHGFADLEAARADMARIRQPVVWLAGDHDYWVNRNRVHDVLSVPAPADRELLQVPTGHFVRSSTEAMATFRVVTERIVQRLAGRVITAANPDLYTLRRTRELEQGRLKPVDYDAQAWWREYLLGNRENPLGFDLLTLTPEYRELLDKQVQLLDLQPNQRVADLGCGTGNMLAALVQTIADRIPGVTLEAADLVPEALDTARNRVQRAAAEIGVPAPPTRYHAIDLSLRDLPSLPYRDASLDRVVMSLVLPYLEDPGPLLQEIFRVLRPGGRLVLSSLRPDVDMSGPVTRLRDRVERGGTHLREGLTGPQLTVALRDYINRAAALIDLEAEGRFHFHERHDLDELLAAHGFREREIVETFGSPPLALVAVAVKPSA